MWAGEGSSRGILRPSSVLGEYLYSQILDATLDNLSGRGSFNIIVNHQAFISISQLSECSGPENSSYCDRPKNKLAGSVVRLVTSLLSAQRRKPLKLHPTQLKLPSG